MRPRCASPGWLAFSLLALACGSEPDVQEAGAPDETSERQDAVRNGTETAAMDRSVFLLTGNNNVIGTATNVKYKRCLLTARHNILAGVSVARMGQNAMAPGAKTQAIDRGTYRAE